jgi:hypothetical protein
MLQCKHKISYVCDAIREVTADLRFNGTPLWKLTLFEHKEIMKNTSIF